MNSHYPCSENDAFYLAGITLQVLSNKVIIMTPS